MDSEKDKLRSALGSAIMVERPIVKVRKPTSLQLCAVSGFYPV